MARKNPDPRNLMPRDRYGGRQDRWGYYTPASETGDIELTRNIFVMGFRGSNGYVVIPYVYDHTLKHEDTGGYDPIAPGVKYDSRAKAESAKRLVADRMKRAYPYANVQIKPGFKTMLGVRRNPSLIVLSNPLAESEAIPAPPAAWEKFHLRERDRARMTHVASIPGVPERVTSLGLCEGVEMVDQHGTDEVVNLDPNRSEGPWLVTDDETMSRLWIVSKVPITDLLAYEGYRSKAVMYFPPANSGKYDATRGYRHEWGDGGRYAKRDWPAKAYPLLVKTHARAYEFTDGAFKVRPEGIVG